MRRQRRKTTFARLHRRFILSRVRPAVLPLSEITGDVYAARFRHDRLVALLVRDAMVEAEAAEGTTSGTPGREPGD